MEWLWVSRFSREVCSWDPAAALAPLSVLPVLPRAFVPWLEAAGCAARDTSTELLCCCHCCCCCPRNCSQGGFKPGIFSSIWISVVFKRLFVTRSDFSARHMGRSPETPQGGCSLSNLPMFLSFLVQGEWPSPFSLQLCATGCFLHQGSLWLSVAAPELLWAPTAGAGPCHGAAATVGLCHLGDANILPFFFNFFRFQVEV